MIFPKEILENTHPVFAKKRNKKSHIIYWLMLLCLSIGLSLLPVIKTDIYFSTSGIIRSSEEKINLISPKAGYVVKSRISYNEKVNIGDTLLIVDRRILKDKLNDLNVRIQLCETRINDLNYLLFSKSPDPKYINTPAFRTDLAQYKQRIQKTELDIQTYQRALQRQQKLYDEEVISQSEFETHRYKYQFSRQEKALLIQEKRAIWDSERKSLKDELVNLNHEYLTLKNSQNEYILISKMSGTIYNNKEIAVGAFINQGEVLGEISPNMNLVAELYIPTSKIGLLISEQKINYQIDAFNYRNWGQATGEIIELSEEIEIVNNTAVFKLIASINETHLSLKNGTRGNLKKGLTLTSQFIIAKRSLFDLLYDQTDDWINPQRLKQVAQK